MTAGVQTIAGRDDVTVMMRVGQQTIYLDIDHFRRRLLMDCIAQAMPETFDRRAAQLEWARPRPGDFNGRASADELAARDRSLAAAALACRRHAQILRDRDE